MRTPARTFEELIVWQKAHAFVLSVYRLTCGFPREEKFGLTSQLRRAAVSVPGNIAEGFKRRGRTDKARLMNVAEGSLEEARYYLRLAGDLDTYQATHSLRTSQRSADCWALTRGACACLLPPNSFLLTPSS